MLACYTRFVLVTIFVCPGTKMFNTCKKKPSSLILKGKFLAKKPQILMLVSAAFLFDFNAKQGVAGRRLRPAEGVA